MTSRERTAAVIARVLWVTRRMRSYTAIGFETSRSASLSSADTGWDAPDCVQISEH